MFGLYDSDADDNENCNATIRKINNRQPYHRWSQPQRSFEENGSD